MNFRMGGEALASRLMAAPVTVDPAAIIPHLDDLVAELGPEQGALVRLPLVTALLSGVFAGSPYLAGQIRRDPARLHSVLTQAPEERVRCCIANMRAAGLAAGSLAELMTALRQGKSDIALTAALADLGGVWPVMTVTRALSEAADAAIGAALDFLFAQAAAKGDWVGSEPPSGRAAASGYFVLGMGKYGAFELNYSSDIDLIVFYEPEKLRLREGVEPQGFTVRLTRDLVKILQERTADGYVFRTDLRLRPDAGATQVAISVPAALHYYETVGQNWERAAMIKARVVGGDGDAGGAFLRDLGPYVWRKYLDFAAISDIHAMKRQIHAFRGFGEIGIAGHNIKLGRGGIREIEFFAQTQQLIAGGRQRDLRVPDTLTALARLTERHWIEAPVRDELSAIYLELRSLEHRLQMVADEQTQELPDDAAPLAAFARFAGFADIDALARHLVPKLERVQHHYAALFEDSPELTRGGVNMVFAGEADDPQTVAALAKMGYSQPPQVIAAVRGWHHGRYPAVRTPRARELLTEVQPLLIEALSETANPDSAFASFDRFLSELPSGVQLFSLLRANPKLLRLVADIMGSAPRLARIMSKRRRVLDAVLDPRVIGSLPEPGELKALVAAELGEATDFQDLLDRARAIGNEQSFLIGVRILSGMISASQAGHAYSLLAEEIIATLHRFVIAEFERLHGRIEGGASVVVAMGKLGGREMTAASDLDLIVIYDHVPEAVQSDGGKPLAPSQYYARLTQRLVTALSAPTAEGLLYEVDLRLRPSGQKGPMATQFSSFVHYQANEAWTWEHMALTRARVISGDGDLQRRVEEAIAETLRKPRDRAKIAADVRDMRQRIAAEKGTADIWELKQVAGGLVDLEFMAQHLQLVAAAAHPEVLSQTTLTALQREATAGVLDAESADVLIPLAKLINDLTHILRLCLEGPFDPKAAPAGLLALLARAANLPTFAHLEKDLQRQLADAAARFEAVVT
jgi:glutamate-ammonia-ligase adenylyltransferase